MAVVAGGGSTALVHVMQQEEEMGLDHQFIGGIALFPVFQQGQDVWRHRLVESGAIGIKAFHGSLVFQERKDVFVVAGIIFGAFEQGGVKQDVEVFSVLLAALFDGVDCVGQYDDQIAGMERVCLPPQRDLHLSLGAVDQFEIVVPVQGK